MKSWIPVFKRSFPSTLYRVDSVTLENYASDAWLASATPEVVCFPKNVKHVSAILKFATRYQVPLTARGAGKGYVGGCVPVKGGIVLSLEKMNRILEINPEDGVAVVEPGVITGHLQEAVKKQGLFYPPDPASLKDCFIGGNVATNAGGPRCLKYGVTRNYILGLEVVLADGTIVNVGGRTMKNKTGFDLVGLFVGSEGLLGIVTKITVRLIPHPQTRGAICAFFESPLQAARGVQMILKAGLLPATLEVADRLTLEAARQAMGVKLIPPSDAYLLVETDGTERAVRADLKSIEKILCDLKPERVQKAYGNEATEKLWELRRQFSGSLRSTGMKKLNEDIVIPRSRLVDLFKLSERIQKQFGIPVASFGHAGDGNIHVNLMLDPENAKQKANADKALDLLFKQVIAWKGAITGEHGVGLAKMPWWSIAASPELRQLHRTVKQALDPKGILNPGKFV